MREMSDSVAIFLVKTMFSILIVSATIEATLIVLVDWCVAAC